MVIHYKSKTPDNLSNIGGLNYSVIELGLCCRTAKVHWKWCGCSTFHFDRPIDRFENPLGTVSKNKQAVMMKASAFSIKENQDLLENTIYLISSKN